jgi:hypothetical protein
MVKKTGRGFFEDENTTHPVGTAQRPSFVLSSCDAIDSALLTSNVRQE